jgi:hypothetical protein
MNKSIPFLMGLFILASCSSDKRSGQAQQEQPLETTQHTVDYPVNLQNAFKAHGGVSTWERYGTLEYQLLVGDRKENHTIDLKTRKVLIESEEFSIGFDGKEVWINPSKEAMGGQSPRFYHNLFFYFFSLPLILSDPGINYEDLGRQDLDGITYDAVKISYDEGVGDSPEDFYIPLFDTTTHVMNALLYTVTYRTGEATSKYNALVYKGWTQVDGLLVPTSLTGYKYEDGRLGDQRYAVTFENISFNEKQPDQQQFEIPAGAEIDSLIQHQ